MLLLCVSIAGCASGDFGRTRTAALGPDMHAWVGAEAALSNYRYPSSFQLTDAEAELRNRAYYFIEPPRARSAWAGVFGTWAPIPAPWRQPITYDRTAYGRFLIDEPHLSQASRYAMINDDVRNDLNRLGPFFMNVTKVADMDQKRSAAMAHIRDLTPPEYSDALSRMYENAVIVQWVAVCVKQRVMSYKWALERLVVMAPDPAAAEVDRLITQLSRIIDVSVEATPVVNKVLTVKG